MLLLICGQNNASGQATSLIGQTRQTEYGGPSWELTARSTKP